MTLTLAEGLVNEVYDYFSANLSTKLTALDTEYTDAIVLRNPAVIYVGIKSLKSIPHKPALFIFSPEQRFKARSTTGGATKPTLVVGIVEDDMDSETLQRRLYRYGRALIELLLAGSADGGIAGWIITTDEEWVIDHTTARQTDSEDSDFVGEVTLEAHAYAWEE